MGKGARSREKNADKKVIRAEKNQTETKKAKWGKFWTVTISLVLVVVVASTMIVYNFFYANGKYLRDAVVMETENFEVDNAMATYNFRNIYANLVDFYNETYSGFTAVDTSRSLKAQDYDADRTWFDYILDTTVTTTEEMLVWYEKALADGLSLSEQEIEAVNEYVDESLSSYFFENGINSDDIVKAVELGRLANKSMDVYRDEVEFTDEEIESFYEENPTAYNVITYRTYNLIYNQEGEVDETFAAEIATEFENAKTSEEFDALIEKAEKEASPDIDEDYVQIILDASVANSRQLDETDAFSTWAFEEGRVENEIYVYHDEEIMQYEFYMLTNPPAKDSRETIEFKHILLETAEDETAEDTVKRAEELLAQWEEAGKTDEAFNDLVVEYSVDTGSNLTGGSYEGVREGDMVDEMDEWIFDESRQEGDVEIISTTYGVHLTVFVSNTGESWEQTIISDMTENGITEMTEELKTLYPVTIDEEKMQDIPE